MTVRHRLSRGLFMLGCGLLAAALVMLAAGVLLPAESFRDLARVVGAMLLAAIAVVPFGLALALGRGTAMPAWMLGIAWTGVVVGIAPAFALLAARF